MTTIRLAPPAPNPIRQFAEAVHTLSDDPRPVNVERYLEASRALEDSKLSRPERDRSGARPLVEESDRA